MTFKGKLSQYKQVLGIIVAVGILAAVFIPFQTATAFTVDVDFPDDSDNSVAQKVTGENFDITVTVAAGELISLQKITLILDNGQSSYGIARFDSSGTFADGNRGLVVDNDLDITLSSSNSYGYAYGYGLVSNGYSFSAPYSYSFSSSNTFLGGNTGGYSNPGSTSFVNGLIGPGTITISGALRTSNLAAGSHTLDVLVDTGGNGNNQDQLVAPTFTFTVTANSNVASTSLVASSNAAPTTITAGTSTVVMDFGNVVSGGDIFVESVTANFLLDIYTSIFESVFSDIAEFSIDGDSAMTIGEIVDIDASGLIFTGTVDVTISYDPELLPSGMSEDDVKFFHWTGTEWEDVTLSVDTSANTVTGRLSSFSPVVAGVNTGTNNNNDNDNPSNGGGHGNSGTVVVGPSQNDFTSYPDSYFIIHPLAKVQVLAVKFLDATGAGTQTVQAGEKISVSSSFKNYQEGSQPYALIIQIMDNEGNTVALDYRMGTLAPAATAIFSTNWTAEESGAYDVQVFVWDGLGEAPAALSEVSQSAVNVQ